MKTEIQTFVICDTWDGSQSITINNRAYKKGELVTGLDAESAVSLMNEKKIEKLSDRIFQVKSLSVGAKYNNVYSLGEKIRANYFENPDDLVRLGYLIEIKE